MRRQDGHEYKNRCGKRKDSKGKRKGVLQATTSTKIQKLSKGKQGNLARLQERIGNHGPWPSSFSQTSFVCFKCDGIQETERIAKKQHHYVERVYKQIEGNKEGNKRNTKGI